MVADAVRTWDDALRAAACLSAQPGRYGGVRLRVPAGAVRDAWLAALRAARPAGQPWVRLPAAASAEALEGGLDWSATLQAGRPVHHAGLVAAAAGGVLLVPMAERLDPLRAALLAKHLDAGRHRFDVVALDESEEDGEGLPAALAERLAFHLDLRGLGWRDVGRRSPDPGVKTLDDAIGDDTAVTALAGAAMALGIASLRPPGWAWSAARDAAGRIDRASLDWVVRCMLAPRATRRPQPAEHEPPPGPTDDADPQPTPDTAPDRMTEPTAEQVARQIAEQMATAAAAVLPASLLGSVPARPRRRNAGTRAHGAGAEHAADSGRPAGVCRARDHDPRPLHLVETLRAALPWQPLRGAAPPRLAIRRDDLRVHDCRRRRRSTTVFALDASGSQALHRLGEAKGAIELLLAECYVRRDRVAVLAFRGSTVDLVLPPTRSLARARRSLEALAGGGGTPLARALDAAGNLAATVQRGGDSVLVVLLTDGRATVARDGSPGRERAEADALRSAASLRAGQVPVLLVDTAPQPQPAARRLADALGARYHALPHAAAQDVSAAVRAAQAEGGRGRRDAMVA